MDLSVFDEGVFLNHLSTLKLYHVLRLSLPLEIQVLWWSNILFHVALQDEGLL